MAHADVVDGAAAPGIESALWRRLRALSFDASFIAKLAREQGWSRTYSERVVEEYRRFLLLAAGAAGHVASPSDAVDQAWHQHLLDTRAYWNELCGSVLEGRPLHHTPARGTAADAARYRALYAETLESYRRVFGCAPPCDIWPSLELRGRVQRRSRWRRVDVAGCVVVRARAHVRRRRRRRARARRCRAGPVPALTQRRAAALVVGGDSGGHDRGARVSGCQRARCERGALWTPTRASRCRLRRRGRNGLGAFSALSGRVERAR